MGIVIRQSGISAIFTYLGVAIGYINVLWLFPSFLSTEEIGLLRILPSAALVILPLAQLGIPQSLLKFYPELKHHKNGVAQLSGILLIGLLIGFLVFGSLTWLFYAPITNYFIDKSELFVDYFHVVICLVILFSIHALFEIYARTLHKIIAINVIKEVLIRLLTSFAVTLYFLKYLSFSQLTNGLIVIYSIALCSLLLYLNHLKQLKISFHFDLIDKVLLTKISNYSIYALLGSGGAYILLNIDQVMISSMIGLSENGVYTTAFYIGVVIEMVKRPISQITSPLVSESFERKDISSIEKIYKQVSINQMIIGGLLLVGIICNLDNLYLLMPNSEAFIIGKWVMIFIGFAKFIDMTFGINGEIIVMSDYYRFNMITVIVLALFTIASNYLLIPLYGINGAALATLISITLFNMVKMIFIYIKFDITPFSLKNLTMLLIISITFLLGLYFPKFDHILLDLVLRSVIITVFFIPLVYFLKVSKEINRIVDQVINKKFKP